MGGVAVVASLVYVGLEVRQSTSVARVASHHWIIESFNQWNLAVAQDPVLVRIFREGLTDRSALNEDERGQLDWLALAAFRLFETIHHESSSGSAEHHLLLEQERGFTRILRTKGAREWWRQNAYPFSEEFCEYINGLLVAARHPVEA